MSESACPNAACLCTEWPPTECPQCETTILGATGTDWRDHFENDCNPLGSLYCFVAEAPEP